MIQCFLATKLEYSFVADAYLLLTWLALVNKDIFEVKKKKKKKKKNMAGFEQVNISNKEFMEEVVRYEYVYHRNSKDFKDKNKKANSWEKWRRRQRSNCAM